MENCQKVELPGETLYNCLVAFMRKTYPTRYARMEEAHCSNAKRLQMEKPPGCCTSITPGGTHVVSLSADEADRLGAMRKR